MLTLQVTPWNVDPVWDTSVGERPYASVVVGSWEIREWSGEIGGNFVPVLDPGQLVGESSVGFGDRWLSRRCGSVASDKRMKRTNHKRKQ